MKLCMCCLEELFDKDTICYKCNSDKLIDDKEFQQIQTELKLAKRKEIDKLLLMPKYKCVNDYLSIKQTRDERYPEILQYNDVSQDVNSSYIKPDPQPTSPTITCPTCGSTNTRKMGSIERGASILTFGIFSKKINKTFKCQNCGMTF